LKFDNINVGNIEERNKQILKKNKSASNWAKLILQYKNIEDSTIILDEKSTQRYRWNQLLIHWFVFLQYLGGKKNIDFFASLFFFFIFIALFLSFF